MPSHTASDLPAKARETYNRLLTMYGERPLVPRREPLHELISTMLSHRTTQQNEARAFDAMWQHFGSWQAILDAPVDDLAKTIELANFPESKAPRIQATLKTIMAERGEPSIDFLADMPTDEALRWLVALPGVGIKTASLVLLFCFAKPVLPVDTHVHRVSQRVGLIGPKVSANAAHLLLLDLLPPEPHVLYNFHIAMLQHGQRVCIWRAPRCAQCLLPDICNWYQTYRASEQALPEIN